MKTLINQFIILFFLLLSFFGQSQDISIVYIARNNGFAGSGAPAYIFADYEYLGKLKNKNYIEYKTKKTILKIGLMSNMGFKKAIEVSLNPDYPTYVNVNLSKFSNQIKAVNNDRKLKGKVIKRINSETLIRVGATEREEKLSKYRKKLSKVYDENLSISNREILNQIEAERRKTNQIHNKQYATTNINNQTKKTPSKAAENDIAMNAATALTGMHIPDATSGTSSTQNKDISDSISVSEIYQKHLDYIDPENKLPNIKSITQTDKTVSMTIANGFESPSSFVYLNHRTLDGKLVNIMKMENMNTKTLYDGVSGYTEMSNGYKTDLPKSTITVLENNPKYIIAEQNTPQNAIVKLKSFQGKDVYSVEYNMHAEIQDYYDVNTFLKVATITNTTNQGLNNQTITLYQDYKKFDGILRPTKIQSEITTKSENLNSTIKSQSEVEYKFNEDFNTYANLNIESISSNIASIPNADINFDNLSIGQSSNSSSNDVSLSGIESEEDLINSDAFNRLNKREQAYQLMLVKQKETGTTSSTGFSTNTAPSVESSGERERISKMDAANAGKLKYRRSSLYTIMLDDNTREHYNIIKDAFGNTEMSEKFNNHNIGPYLIPAHGMGGEKDQTAVIEDYLNYNGVAKNLVARWFNRNENGHFDMNLIAERGQYNASEIDLRVAQSSMRGKALLSDAGKELISNTFVIVYDYKYTNKEEQAKKRKGFLNAVTTVASFVPGGEDIATVSSLATTASDVVGKGYFVRTTSYLYRLVWNDDIAEDFYNDLWIDEYNDDSTKKAAFDNSTLFRLEYVGSEVSRNNLQSTIFSAKSNEQLIDIATTKAVDKNISKLQRSYEQFKVKTPLLSAEPIAAKIGLKEGIEKGDKFEVLEQVLNEDGTTSYERVTTIKVDKNHIWDNSYLAEEAGTNTTETYTVFKGNSNKVAPGMLIRQLK